MLKVVHVVVAGQAAGAERFLVDLASRPSETRASHVVALMTPNEKVRQLFQGAGLKIHDRGPVRENPIAYLRMSLGRTDVAWVEFILREEHADVAHLHTFASHVLGTRAARQAGVRVLRTEHDTHYFTDPSCSPFTRWSLRRTDRVVAISKHVADFVARTAPYAKEKMSVVLNGVDADRFAPRLELAPKAGPLRFVLACRLEPRKQPDVVVRAVAATKDAELDVFGDGSMRGVLDRLVRELGASDRIRVHGYSADPRDAIARADACVSGAKHEPLGLSVLEGLSMGKPVIAFAVGGIPEMIRDEETGFLIRDTSVDAMQRVMARVTRSQLRAMGERARGDVLAHHRIETMCAGYAEQYEIACR
jgi:glycosyltransferase involved in cell wall biosynthesis